MDNTFIFLDEKMKEAGGAMKTFAEAVTRVLQPEIDVALKLHKLLLLDPKYAKKFRHYRKYTRMYERGKRNG